jgi:hypothetical protein
LSACLHVPFPILCNTHFVYPDLNLVFAQSA